MMNELSQEERQEREAILKKAILEEDVYFLCRHYFDIKLSPLQQNLVRKIAFKHYKRFSISAMTRWGKSFCISLAIALFLILNEEKQIVFIAPTQEQSMVLRDYLAGFIKKCEALLEIADLSATREERLTSQTSKAYQSFKNGNSYRVFTAFGEAENLMGHGLKDGILVIDEACLINNTAYSKIMRMLGDNPEENILIESFNPWTRSCRAFEHSINPNFHNIHIGWEDAIKDKRTTENFIEEQRKELTALEFDVLYNSVFPSESADSVFNLDKIRQAEKKDTTKNKSGEFIISCDVADSGIDKTIIMTGFKNDEGYFINSIYSEDKSENTAISGRIMKIIKENLGLNHISVFIDCIGVGTGVYSMVKQEIENINYSRKNEIKITGCHFGKSPTLDKERFSNRKAENYFRLKELFEEGMIRIPHNKILLNELLSMRWTFTSTSKIRIIDPDKSPDFCDCLVYFVWYEEPEINLGGRRIF